MAEGLPRKTNVDGDSWVKACKPSDWVDGSSVRTADRSWMSTFDVGWKGQYGVGSHDFAHGCCEARLSWRLAARQVSN